MAECHVIDTALAGITVGGVGTRQLLDEPWCRALAERIRTQPGIAALLPQEALAVQCSYFEKSNDKNWLVAVHQDVAIPVAAQVSHPELRNWRRKEDAWFVQPPLAVLEQLVAVRVHIDPCGQEDGPLKVVPGSHRLGLIPAEAGPMIRERLGEQACTAQPGDALLMSPLLLHASSKAHGTSRRRVLHFLFGPSKLPFGLQWRDAT